MIKLITQSIRQTLVWTVITGMLYPLAITAIAQLAFHDKANGSLVERDGKVAGIARRNADHVGASVQVTTSSVSALLSGTPDRAYDIVWLDPPYALGAEELSAAVEAVLERGWLAEDGLLVIERSSRTPDPVLPAELAEVWGRRYGETTVHYATRKAGQ